MIIKVDDEGNNVIKSLADIALKVGDYRIFPVFQKY